MSGKARSARGTSSGALAGEAMRFAMVGVAATAAHYTVALLLADYGNVYGANLLGYLAAVAISYFGHQRVSFQLAPGDISHRRQLPRFVLGSLGGLALSYLVLAIAAHLLGAPDWLALAAAVGLVPIYSFLFNKLWVFHRAGDGPGQ